MYTLSTFIVIAHADPQALTRILGLFGQRGVIPAEVHAQSESDILIVNIAIEDLPGEQARAIAGKLEGLMLVRTVEMSTVDLRPSADTSRETAAATPIAELAAAS